MFTVNSHLFQLLIKITIFPKWYKTNDKVFKHILNNMFIFTQFLIIKEYWQNLFSKNHQDKTGNKFYAPSHLCIDFLTQNLHYDVIGGRPTWHSISHTFRIQSYIRKQLEIHIYRRVAWMLLAYLRVC